jgi:ribosomal-protein-serine acetyltransferase
MEKQLRPASVAKAEIDRLVGSFFELFSNRDGIQPNLSAIFELFVPQGIITKTSGQEPEISSLQDFISPRQALLTDGTLTDFSETEVSHSTFIFGKIAHRASTYRKSGRFNGEWFSAQGMKSFQFIHTATGWRISSMAWDDERPGLMLSAAQVFDTHKEPSPARQAEGIPVVP